VRNTYCILIFLTRKWEEVDHEFEESIGASLLEPSTLVEREKESDPLGLPHSVEYVPFPCLLQCLIILKTQYQGNERGN